MTLCGVHRFALDEATYCPFCALTKARAEVERLRAVLTEAVVLMEWAQSEARGRLPERWHRGVAVARNALAPAKEIK